MVGRRSFPFRFRTIFRAKVLVLQGGTPTSYDCSYPFIYIWATYSKSSTWVVWPFWGSDSLTFPLLFPYSDSLTFGKWFHPIYNDRIRGPAPPCREWIASPSPSCWGHRNPTLLMRRVVPWRSCFMKQTEVQQSNWICVWSLEVTWQLNMFICVYPFLSMCINIHVHPCASIFNRKTNTSLAKDRCFPPSHVCQQG